MGQLDANFVCLMFGAGQVVYNEPNGAFPLEKAACCSWKWDNKDGESQPKYLTETNELRDAKESCKSLWVDYYEWPP